PPKALRDHVLLPRVNAAEQGILSVNFVKKLAKAVGPGKAVALSLDFSDNPLSHLGRNVLRRQILKQLRKAGLPVVPVHLEADHLPGGLLRRAIPGLPHRASHQPVQVGVRIGRAIPPADLAAFPKTRLWGQYLQAKIFSLGSPLELHPHSFGQPKTEQEQPLAPPADPQLVAGEIAALPPEMHLVARGQFDVYVAPFRAIPNTLFEIARLRELTFRTVGEGSGKPRDMDEFDVYYLHLVIWDREAQRIVGGYRLGLGDQIFKHFGVNGFYVNTLFKLKRGLYPVLRQSVELGRSYVVPEYQKHRLPLFLLWKGILHFLLANPRYRYLYGPVSISKNYSDASKAVMVEFVRRFFFDPQLSKWVLPRKPYRPRLRSINAKLVAEHLNGEFDALEALVESIEPEHFKVPVLFRQYLKQNAKFLAFNVDPLFSDCLDGLMLLDIAQLPASTIEALQ
ncbi:MAG TPA: lysophospholipid acyltransferase family protein, partial [Saprospiraceae bacterium]|nr:lysophospholipid acyltransferase family protein [Saprospiraceae bacterium]